AVCVVVAGPGSRLARGFGRSAALHDAESMRMTPGKIGDAAAALVSGADERGYVYALLELAERVEFGEDPIASISLAQAVEEAPANEKRCVSRYFCCELEDKPWFYDRAFWTGYLDRLVASRFNRFSMAFGLEYDFPRGVTGDYLHFVYPYLVEVPGYEQVRILQLAKPDGKRLATPVEVSKEERAKNLAALKYIARETGARGLQFQLAIWTHAYAWTDSPDAYHRIEGLTSENHATYCRDALAMILRECPEIQGLTMRVHGESGIPEGSYGFWQTVFEAIKVAGRTIEIDMHAKGVDQKIIDIAAATGMPVKLGAKYSAEHQSLGYNQADIRALEIPDGNLSANDAKLFSLSSGSRKFTRYGYADFLREDSKFQLWFRLWPGTQRHLLCVDPETIEGYARTVHFCGAGGIDLMEPLTFKGREGSGAPGGRCAYADATLNPRYDWQKYDLYYRVWGRKLYNPDADAEVWRRAMRAEFGAGAEATETALGKASKILALMTSAHLPSASNHDLWYEMPENMPIVKGSEPSPYGDTPTPKIFQTVSPLDPQMFATVVEYVDALNAKKPLAKYSPVEVARWVELCVADSRAALDEARKKVHSAKGSAFRRVEEDVLIQLGLGELFAHKLQGAVLYEIFENSGDHEVSRAAIAHYTKARAAWAVMAERAKVIYRADVGYGRIPKRRGHWLDRIAGIDKDVAAMKSKVAMQLAMVLPHSAGSEATAAMAGLPDETRAHAVHNGPGRFAPGKALALTLDVKGEPVDSVRLRYRHVNQAERWNAADTHMDGERFMAEIPAEYTQSEYALEYYFELERGGRAWMYPGFDETLSNQPYFAVWKRTT
ncbi:MAG: hypothetical protein KGN79_01750, partial [Acidobacteriota bacterium]|nr:hypothetical protein [Acidobacteriota bacterium]